MWSKSIEEYSYVLTFKLLVYGFFSIALYSLQKPDKYRLMNICSVEHRCSQLVQLWSIYYINGKREICLRAYNSTRSNDTYVKPYIFWISMVRGRFLDRLWTLIFNILHVSDVFPFFRWFFCSSNNFKHLSRGEYWSQRETKWPKTFP